MKTSHLVIITLGIIASSMVVFVLNSYLNTPPPLTSQNSGTLSGNYTIESKITGDVTYLSQTVDEWKSKTPEQLRAYYEKYKDAIYDELVSFLIKNEKKKELARQNIQNAHDDFKVFSGSQGKSFKEFRKCVHGLSLLRITSIFFV